MPYVCAHFSLCIAPRILDFSQNLFKILAFSDAKSPTFLHIFVPTTPRIWGYLQDFPSSDAKFLQFFHILGPTAPNICVHRILSSSDANLLQSFHFLASLYRHRRAFAPLQQELLFFTGFSLFYIFPHVWPCCTKNPWGFHKSFLF